MVDVGGLVTAVMPYLVTVAGTYGAAVVRRVADSGADAAAEATVGLGRRLLRRLLSTPGPAKDAVEAAVTDLGEHPDDEDFQHAVRAQLKKALAADPQLGAELAQMLHSSGVQVIASGERSAASHTNSGIMVTGDDAHIQR